MSPWVNRPTLWPDVSSYPHSDQLLCRSEMTLRANTDQSAVQQSRLLVDHLVGAQSSDEGIARPNDLQVIECEPQFCD
jgi:hypothetical protein